MTGVASSPKMRVHLLPYTGGGEDTQAPKGFEKAGWVVKIELMLNEDPACCIVL